jgi:type II secretory pathway pseudopilin PulG
MATDRTHVFYSQPYIRKAITKIEVMLAAGVLGLLMVLVVPSLRSNKVARMRQACIANLARIGQGLESYLNNNGNRWPFVSKLDSVKPESSPWPTLPKLLASYMNGGMDAFHCPADQRRLDQDNPLAKKFPRSTSYYDTEGTSYEWWFGEIYGGKKVGEESLARAGGFGMGRADEPLLTDFEPFHKGDDQGAINTLNADLKPRTTRARPLK